MKFVLSTLFLCLVLPLLPVTAQKRRPVPKRTATEPAKIREIGQIAVVMDETLSVLRPKPSLFAVPLQRMRRGRIVKILGVAEADGIKFLRVSAPPGNVGWVQSDAVFARYRAGDDARLAKLIQSMKGFDQIEAAFEFFNLYPQSPFRPPLLLLFGDLIEDTAAKLSRDATNRLDRAEMAASAAPLHSYYLNFVSLDRYRKIGITFLFNPSTKQFHYDGASWREIVAKYPGSTEAAEAEKRLSDLNNKMARNLASQ